MSIDDEIDELLNKKVETEIVEPKGKMVTKIHFGRKPEPVKPSEPTIETSFDTIQEQIESPMTTIHCPESIKKEQLKDIDKKPENYIEINMVKKIRVVDNFYIPSNLKKFSYKDMEYNIVEEKIYIFPTKNNFFMPTCFFYENNPDPIGFEQKNEGITGKALTLGYNPDFYQGLHDPDEVKYNLFIVVCLIISISGYFIGLYFLLTNILGLG